MDSGFDSDSSSTSSACGTGTLPDWMMRLAAELRTHDTDLLDVTVPTKPDTARFAACALGLFECLALAHEPDAGVCHPNVAFAVLAGLLRPRAWRVTRFASIADGKTVRTSIRKCRATCALRDGNVAMVVPRRDYASGDKPTYGLVVVDPSTGQLLEDYRRLSPHWVVNARSIAELTDGQVAVSVQRRDRMHNSAIDVIARDAASGGGVLRKVRAYGLGGSVGISAMPGNRLLACDYDGDKVAVLEPSNLMSAPYIIVAAPADRTASGSLGVSDPEKASPYSSSATGGYATGERSAGGMSSSDALGVDDDDCCSWDICGASLPLPDCMSCAVVPTNFGRHSAAGACAEDAVVRCVSISYSKQQWAILDCSAKLGIVDGGPRNPMYREFAKDRSGRSEFCAISAIDNDYAIVLKEGAHIGMLAYSAWQLAPTDDDITEADGTGRPPDSQVSWQPLENSVFAGREFFDSHYCPETRLYVAGDVGAIDGGFACYRVPPRPLQAML